jgi:hypothetical protein
MLFADDRLKSFSTNWSILADQPHADAQLPDNAYVGCVDDAADLMQEGVQKQLNVRAGIDLIASKTKEFPNLEKLQTEGKEIRCA